MEKIFTLFKGGITTVTPHENIDLVSTYNLIKSENYKDKTLKLRLNTNEAEKAKLKSSLDYATFSGTFSSRKVASLIKHSGWIR